MAVMSMFWQLLRAQRASMSPQDWAQITFRSEMHLNDFNNESGSQLEKREKSGSGDLSTIYRESQNGFLLQSTTTNNL